MAGMTPTSTAPGTKTSRKKTVVKTVPPEKNDNKNVSRNPDHGRIVVKEPDGTEYTTVPSFDVMVGGKKITLIKEPA
ncbi:MAG: hypothetical protein NVSMB14_01290 [Isosphaeraceae bacterium]